MMAVMTLPATGPSGPQFIYQADTFSSVPREFSIIHNARPIYELNRWFELYRGSRSWDLAAQLQCGWLYQEGRL
jgi:hypothetical protein